LKVVYILTISIFLSSSLFSAITNGYRDFSIRHHVFYKGDLVSIGNSVLVPPTNQSSNTCSTYTNGPYSTNVSGSNANYYLCGYKVDAGTTNSTTAELNLPAGATVQWAGLYWQALVKDNSFSTNMNIKIKKDSGAYTTIGYDDIDYLSGSGKSGYTSYSAFKDITTMFTSNNWADGNYTVANIPVHQGKVDTLGTYGAWNLVVIYEDLSQAQKFRSFSVFDGWKVVKDANNYRDVQIDLSGFYTPKETPINANIAVFVAEGDKHIYGDYLKTFNYNNSPASSVNLMPSGETSQTFNSSISGTYARTPKLVNNNGIDIQTHSIGNYLKTEQTDIEFHFTSNQDTYWPSVLAFSTELYVPEFCYDYAYSQQGIYFTEENDGSKNPEIVGSVIREEPVEVKFFIRNLVDSDIEVTDMLVNITDINTTQAKYISDSTKLAKKGNLIPKALSDSADLNVGNDSNGDYIKGINVGEISSNDNFYVYYELNPKQSELNMPMSVKANYNLVISNGTIIPYSLSLKSDIPICSTSNFVYAPAKGIFNLVHNNYDPYYNLPTQVTSREGNFKVKSLDPSDFETPKSVSTVVAVEMIDSSAFHDTNASCLEMASAISPRVWITFDNEAKSVSFDKTTLQNAIIDGMTTLSSSSDFYSVAKQNAAFRVSYNTTNDANASLVKIVSYPFGYKIENFSKVKQGISACSQSVKLPNGTYSTSIADACKDPQNTAITRGELASCMECLYGYNTRLVCSRDNFAIRPEALLMHINDQNQTNPLNPFTPQSRLTTNYSGVAGATANELSLASDYNYVLEINATNHLNNDSSKGYTKSFIEGFSNDIAQYSWSPRNITNLEASTNCNDDDNKTIDMRFLNGKVDINTSVAQVGEYSLGIVDKTWTAVDNNSSFMTHHSGSKFLAGSDCIDGSSVTQNVDSTTNNGCFISSNHTNVEANLKYNDYELTFHPYKYGILNNMTLGLTNRDINTTDDFSNFVYMADISEPDDINMSVQFNSTITPQGYYSSSLTNFVTGCFAKPIDINITKTDPLNTQLEFMYILNDRNNTANTINGTIPVGISRDANLTTTDTFFEKDVNGTLNTIININFDRRRDIAANPEDINYSKLTVSDPRTLLSADLLTNKTAESNISIDQNITHYFGRTGAKRTRIICDAFPCLSGSGQEPDVLIYYEAFCHGNTNGNNCNRNLIPTLGIRHIQIVDSRWYVNLNHQEAGDGNLTATSQIVDGFVTVGNITNRNNYTKDSVHSYNGNGGLPYDANMESVVPRWLMYDEDTAGFLPVTNKHLIHYLSPTQWSGRHETNTTTNTQRVRRVNRRTMW